MLSQTKNSGSLQISLLSATRVSRNCTSAIEANLVLKAQVKLQQQLTKHVKLCRNGVGNAGIQHHPPPGSEH